MDQMIRPGAWRGAGASRPGAPEAVQREPMSAALTRIEHSFRRIETEGIAIRRNAAEMGSNLQDLDEALQRLEQARVKVNEACENARDEVASARKVRCWIDQSRRAMDEEDLGEIQRLLANHPPF